MFKLHFLSLSSGILLIHKFHTKTPRPREEKETNAEPNLIAVAEDDACCCHRQLSIDIKISSFSHSSPVSVSNGVDCCGSFFGLERMFSSPFGTQRSTNELSTESSHAGITRINSPGQRFTATHGISAKRGERKLFVFVVDRTDVNYLAVSSNIAIEGSRGGPERYELYMKYGSPPTEKDFDQRSTLTASDSYVGDVLYR